ncbi:UNVERIFIED_CONTAM: hypothetical protein HDU68_012798 [Siphonaria sp. JEL0065]|nr:hypothetical protein HDU68_012798 [Siphonaria sp. JEL0065]
MIIPLLVLVAVCALAHQVDDTTSNGTEFAGTKYLAPISTVPIPAGPIYPWIVNPLLAQVDVNHITTFLTQLTMFPERFYKSQNGVNAAKWIADHVKALPVAKGTKLTVSYFNHTAFIQPSVIARYENTHTSNLTATVIVGTHFDTIAQHSPLGIGGPNPAADDCASGSASVFEALRVLTSSGWVPGHAIEFHWYAAEEEMIQGSKEISQAYANNGTQVIAYLNVDQTGYVMPGTTPQIGIFVDFTTPQATKFLSATVAAYSGLGQVGNQKCVSECSDHTGWFQAGYQTAFAFEAEKKYGFPNIDVVNPDGTPLDTLEFINMTHVAVFAKNTIGFVVELSLVGTVNGTVSSSSLRTAATSPIVLLGLLLFGVLLG